MLKAARLISRLSMMCEKGTSVKEKEIYVSTEKESSSAIPASL